MEKERYTIESFEIDEPSCIFDNKTQQGILSLVEYNYAEIVNLKNLLNQQNAKIKELESQVKKWKQDYENCSKLEKILTKESQYCLDNWRECEKENQQLKDHIEELEEQLKEKKRKNLKTGENR